MDVLRSIASVRSLTQMRIARRVGVLGVISQTKPLAAVEPESNLALRMEEAELEKALALTTKLARMGKEFRQKKAELLAKIRGWHA